MSCGGGANSLVPSTRAVDTHGFAVHTVARFKDVCVVISWNIPTAPHHIIDMVAVRGSIGPDACPDTELGIGDELGPFMELLLISKNISKKKPSNRVSVTIGTMVVQFSSLVTGRNVDLGKVANTSDLNIIGCLDKVYSCECSCWHDPRAMGTMGTVCYFLSLSVSNSVSNRWCP